ncbi:MAG TPA: flagellar hook basal-body protein, partial [Bryobacteraceae bacterium]|nr:flagellar hook basal-body protein [Bryobacteraceae bacterium]
NGTPRASLVATTMDAIGIAAASGIRARMESLEILANNLANASTSGFKADRERYSTYWSAESTSALDGGRGGGGVSPVVEKNWIDFSQGAITRTGVQTHLAMTGPGFLSVRRGTETLYTRNGELQISARGTLVNGEGLDVMGANGQPVRLDAAQSLEIRADGTVWQGGAQAGRIRLTEFSDPQALQKAGHTYFRWPGPEEQVRAAAGTQVIQGAVESANTGPAEGAVRMVNVLRQFESLQKALQLGNEMSRRLVEEVAKV